MAEMNQNTCGAYVDGSRHFRKIRNKLLMIALLIIFAVGIVGCSSINRKNDEKKETVHDRYSVDDDSPVTNKKEKKDNTIVSALDRLQVSTAVNPDEISTTMLDEYVMSLYPEIHWGYTQPNLDGTVTSYDYPINYEMINHISDLGNKKDVLVYRYFFNTYTACVSGEFECEFEYQIDETWQLKDIRELDSGIEWDLEGRWEFDIWTYYVKVAISGMDFDNQIATIQYWGTSSKVMPGEISFTEDGRYIYFDTFAIYNNKYNGEKKDITLVAGIEDMYFMSPPLSTSGSEHLRAVGGRKSYANRMVEFTDIDDRNILSSEEIASETHRIDEVWEINQQSIKNNKYTKGKINYWYTAYYDEQSMLKILSVPCGHVSDFAMSWQIEDHIVTYAVFENPLNRHLLYFKNGELFKWIWVTKQYGEDISSMTYINDFENAEFIAWEKLVHMEYEEAMNQE